MAEGMQISIKNYAKLCSDLRAMNKDAEKAISRTVADFKSRAPGWISQAVSDEYTIKKSEVKGAMVGAKKIGSIKVSGTMVDNIGLEYKGRLLTPRSGSGLSDKGIPDKRGDPQRQGQEPAERSVPGNQQRRGLHSIPENWRQPHADHLHQVHLHPSNDHQRKGGRGHPEADRGGNDCTTKPPRRAGHEQVGRPLRHTKRMQPTPGRDANPKATAPPCKTPNPSGVRQGTVTALNRLRCWRAQKSKIF